MKKAVVYCDICKMEIPGEHACVNIKLHSPVGAMPAGTIKVQEVCAYCHAKLYETVQKLIGDIQAVLYHP